MFLSFFRLSVLALEIEKRHVQRFVTEPDWLFIDATSANYRLADYSPRTQRDPIT